MIEEDFSTMDYHGDGTGYVAPLPPPSLPPQSSVVPPQIPFEGVPSQTSSYSTLSEVQIPTSQPPPPSSQPPSSQPPMGEHPAVQKVSSQTFNLALRTLAARPVGEENKVPHIDPQQLYEAVDEQTAIEHKMDPQVGYEVTPFISYIVHTPFKAITQRGNFITKPSGRV
eukprot:sb/3472318/